MGKKPLYYVGILRSGAPPLFAFASELKALACVPGFDRSVDPAALARYLAYEYVPAPHAIFRGTSKLPAAHRLVLDLATAGAAETAHRSLLGICLLPTGRPAGARTRQPSAYEPCCATLLRAV